MHTEITHSSMEAAFDAFCARRRAAERQALRRHGATEVTQPVDPRSIRSRADRRRRRTAAASVVVALVVALPVLSLVRGGTDDGLIDQPTTPATEAPASETTVGAEENLTVYSIAIDVDARIEGALADAVSVALASDVLGYTGIGNHGEIPLVLTADRALELALTAEDPTVEDQGFQPGVVRGSVARLEGSEVIVERGTATLRPGEPTLVRVDMTPTGVVDGDPSFQGTTAVLTLSDPAQSDPSSTGQLRLTLTPRPVTGDEGGIPGPQDLPDERLPLPSVGEAIPTQLADGTPVWVVGLDDGAVSVVQARSPHTPSGLVGWCGTMPGFIDSPGAARFDPSGGYAFGPAPHGLTPYEAHVEGDQVIVTRRLAPSPRPDLRGEGRMIPPIIGSALPQGIPCEPGPEAMAQAAVDGVLVEDYRGVQGWVQHDLDDWPRLDGQADGWFHADRADILLGDPAYEMTVTGDLLVRRVDGVTVDVAGPPGSAGVVFNPQDLGRPAPLDLLVGIDREPGCEFQACPNGSVSWLEVVWVTPAGITDVTDDGPPSPDAVLYPRTDQATEPRPLAEGATIDAAIGDLVTVSLDEEGYAVTALASRE